MLVSEFFAPNLYFRILFVVALTLNAIFWLAAWAWAASAAASWNSYWWDGDNSDAYGASMAAEAALGALVWFVVLYASYNSCSDFDKQGPRRRDPGLLHPHLSQLARRLAAGRRGAQRGAGPGQHVERAQAHSRAAYCSCSASVGPVPRNLSHCMVPLECLKWALVNGNERVDWAFAARKFVV